MISFWNFEKKKVKFEKFHDIRLRISWQETKKSDAIKKIFYILLKGFSYKFGRRRRPFTKRDRKPYGGIGGGERKPAAETGWDGRRDRG